MSHESHDGLLDAPEVTRPVVDLEHAPTDVRSKIEPDALWRLRVTALTLAAAVGATYVIPGLAFARPFVPGDGYVPYWNILGRELGLGGGEDSKEVLLAQEEKLAEAEALARDAVAEEPEVFEEREEVAPPPVVATLPPLAPHPDDEAPVEQPLENVAALDAFYASLTRTELGYEGAVTRVAHWGDSVLGNDGITAAIRTQLQARFGDSGHGFHTLAQFNPSYIQKGVRVRYKGDWSFCYIINACKSDGRYGYGGTTVWSAGGGETVFLTANEGAAGRKLSHFELWYAAEPKGGKLRVLVDKTTEHVVETAADTQEDRVFSLDVPDGEHEISVRAVGGGRARAYGVVLERNKPGVVWDGMGWIGSFASRFNNQDPEHLKQQLALRKVDLLAFMFGGNDLLGFSPKRFRENFDGMLAHARAAAPDVPCVVFSIVDHGERKGGGIVTAAGVEEMVSIQREVALERGCAFFDTWTAMGGKGSMGRWNRSDPRLGSGDLAHLTHHGHKVIGAMFYRALMAGYRDYRKRMEGTPIAALGKAGSAPPDPAPSNAEAAVPPVAPRPPVTPPR
jgi:lysophospholipase L1-like esterase